MLSAHCHSCKIVENAHFPIRVLFPFHKRQRLLKGHLASKEFLFVHFERTAGVQNIWQESVVRCSRQSLGFTYSCLRFDKLLSLSVRDSLHHRVAHRNVWGDERSGKRVPQQRKSILIVRLVKKNLRLSVLKAQILLYKSNYQDALSLLRNP